MGEAYAAIKDDAGFGYIVAFFGVIFLGLLIAAYRKDREERKL